MCIVLILPILIALRHRALYCGAIQCDVLFCAALRCDALYNVALHCDTLHCAVLRNTLCCAAFALYSSV
jgi:hypothetical protein